MKSLVLYDSVFGNTAQIAQSIAAALGTTAIPVSQASAGQLAGLDLLVLGSPTRGFRPTEGMAKFLDGLPPQALNGIQAAAFDTRMDLQSIDSRVGRFIVDKGGYAASTIAKAAKKKGACLSAPPEGFLVTGEEGPLKAGELDRAAAWGRSLAVAP